jgi:hypothetical protein
LRKLRRKRKGNWKKPWRKIEEKWKKLKKKRKDL